MEGGKGWVSPNIRETLANKAQDAQWLLSVVADVSVIPESTFEWLKGMEMRPGLKYLTGLDKKALSVCGQFSAKCTNKDRQEFFVVRDLQTALVGHRAIEGLVWYRESLAWHRTAYSRSTLTYSKALVIWRVSTTSDFAREPFLMHRPHPGE